MVLRLILAICVAMAALPMAGAPHGHAATLHAAHHGGAMRHDNDKRIPVEHYCIGCVTPDSFEPVHVAPPPAPRPVVRKAPKRSDGAPRLAEAPATPPPRSRA